MRFSPPHVWENVAFGLKRDGMPKDQIAERVESMLGIVKLKPYAKRKPHQLSAVNSNASPCTLFCEKSEAVLLDEPLGALDRKLREQTQFELVSIIKKVGSLRHVTHDKKKP